jgi:Zn-dependent M28 family amino/carboxypeptidase
MVRNLVHEPPLDYDVLFLFNGAEEPLLPASHAFVTQHPLAKRYSAFIISLLYFIIVIIYPHMAVI